MVRWGEEEQWILISASGREKDEAGVRGHVCSEMAILCIVQYNVLCNLMKKHPRFISWNMASRSSSRSVRE